MSTEADAPITEPLEEHSHRSGGRAEAPPPFLMFNRAGASFPRADRLCLLAIACWHLSHLLKTEASRFLGVCNTKYNPSHVSAPKLFSYSTDAKSTSSSSVLSQVYALWIIIQVCFIRTQYSQANASLHINHYLLYSTGLFKHFPPESRCHMGM